jgi:ADP-heptose:LPS heptosyltransferase
MKFLVIRFSSIGDIVLTTPAIRCLKQQVQNAEVHFLTKQNFKTVTEGNPYIDKFFYFKDNLPTLIKDLKLENYDYIIDLHQNFRTKRIGWALNTKVLTYDKERIAKFLLTKFHINKMSGRHIVDRCLDTLLPLGVIYDGKGMDYFIPPNCEINLKDLPMPHLVGYVAIVIGASYHTKKLPTHKLQELCKKLQYPIILVGGKEDFKVAEEVSSIDPIRVYNACGKYNLHESSDLVRRSKLVISHDTGLQYIACAFDKPVLAIWGGTSPLLDVEPFYANGNRDRFKNFLVEGLTCQPCSNFGTKTCPKKHFKCMEEQNIDAIVMAASSFINA